MFGKNQQPGGKQVVMEGDRTEGHEVN